MSGAEDRMLARGFEPEDIAVLLVKDASNEIWMYHSTWKDAAQLHIRQVYKDFLDDAWHPGKGIAVPLDKAHALITAIAAQG